MSLACLLALLIEAEKLDETDTKGRLEMSKCVACGCVLPKQQTGRPRFYCKSCMRLRVKIQKRNSYLKSKYPGLEREAIQQREQLLQNVRDLRKLKRYIEWKRRFGYKTTQDLTLRVSFQKLHIVIEEQCQKLNVKEKSFQS